MLLADEDLPRDPGRAAPLLAEAAGQGNADAQFLMATLYCRGEGVAADPAAAIALYRAAAEQGHASAQFNLAVMLARGEGVAQDIAGAEHWYAASQRPAAAQRPDLAQAGLAQVGLAQVATQARAGRPAAPLQPAAAARRAGAA